MTRANEPCLCGDPQCPRCFAVTNEAYAADMYLQALRRIRLIALDGSLPAAIACREIADAAAYAMTASLNH